MWRRNSGGPRIIEGHHREDPAAKRASSDAPHGTGPRSSASTADVGRVGVS